MIKAIFLAGAMTLAVPAFAQDMTTPADGAQPAAATTQDAQPASPDTTAQTAPGGAMPAQEATPATEQAADAATSTAGQPVTGASQIAQVVSKEFPTYDKNGDGNLDKAEFAAWMVALKTASDPATKASDPATKSWAAGAFASADTDKSAVVSKEELTKYLSIGAE